MIFTLFCEIFECPIRLNKNTIQNCYYSDLHTYILNLQLPKGAFKLQKE